MTIYPAIDLKDGKAVRLSKGDMNTATIYSHRPEELCKKFEAMGAVWLHIVDLDGAFAGKPQNIDTVKKILKKTKLNVQVGGGIRDEKTIQAYMDIGVSRVILGSVALKNPLFVKDMAAKYPIVVGIDAKDGAVAVQGWAEVSSMKATTLAKKFARAGVKAIICTDIGKDGMLCGINEKFTQDIAKVSGIDTIASGGVKDMRDIQICLSNPNISGVIVGRAYYEKTIDLQKAFGL